MAGIVDQYFSIKDFSVREKEVLEKVSTETGFTPEKLIFRGMIYQPDKIGSIIYKGIYDKKPAILKLQGIKADADEADIFDGFNKQNTSKRIRLPLLYRSQKWNEQDGYGYLLEEEVTHQYLYNAPFITDSDMQLFCDFYQEYRTECLHTPFAPEPVQKNATAFVLHRLDKWIQIADDIGEQKNRMTGEEREQFVTTYQSVMKYHASDIKMVFCHGHLNPSAIHYDGKEFILLSNLYWAYRPELYDMIFNLHWDIQSMHDTTTSYDKFIEYITRWFQHMYEIPVVQKDPDAKRKMHLMLLERTMGALMIDTASRSLPPEEEVYCRHLLSLQMQLFGDIVQRIEDKAWF